MSRYCVMSNCVHLLIKDNFDSNKDSLMPIALCPSSGGKDTSCLEFKGYKDHATCMYLHRVIFLLLSYTIEG